MLLDLWGALHGLENRFTIKHDIEDCSTRWTRETAVTRYTDFSYSAYQIIQKEIQEGRCRKWIAHVGYAHVDTNRNVPGLSQLTGANSLYVFDDNEKTIAEWKINNSLTMCDHTFDCQFLLNAKPGIDLDMRRILPPVSFAPTPTGPTLFTSCTQIFPQEEAQEEDRERHGINRVIL